MNDRASSSRFPFCLYIQTGYWRYWRSWYPPKHGQILTKTPQEKSVSSQRTRRDRIPVNENNPTPTKHHKQKTSLAPLLAAKELGSLYFLCCQDVTWYPNTLINKLSEKAKWGAGTIIPTVVISSPSLCGVSGDHKGSMNFHHNQAVTNYTFKPGWYE